MADGDRLARESSARNQAAELRLRTVVALHDRSFSRPVEDTIPDLVRPDMDAAIQADARTYIDTALDRATERDGDDAGPVPNLHADARDWLAAVSTVPHGGGATNLDGLREAFTAADGGRFSPNEFGDLWQDLRDRLRRD